MWRATELDPWHEGARVTPEIFNQRRRSRGFPNLVAAYCRPCGQLLSDALSGRPGSSWPGASGGGDTRAARISARVRARARKVRSVIKSVVLQSCVASPYVAIYFLYAASEAWFVRSMTSSRRV